MKEIIDKFEEIINEKISSIKYYTGGITNNNYLINDHYLFRVPKAIQQPTVNHNNEMLLEALISSKPYSIDTIYLDAHGYKISTYQKNCTPFSLEKNSIIIPCIIDIIKDLHSLSTKNVEYFDPFERMSYYLLNADMKPLKCHKQIIEDIKPYYSNCKYVVSHNDLVPGNILFDGEQVYLIDYEYSGLNHPFFDIMSFISENNIESTEVKHEIYQCYFDNKIPQDIQKIEKDFIHFLDLLWFYWAKMLFYKTKQDIYQIIAEQKYQRLKKDFNLK